MKTITFKCEVVTPMFLTGADGCTPELRPSSIKGAMRFWWRAMNGHLSLEELRKNEAEILGGSKEKEGRSKVIIRRLKSHNLLLSNEKLPFHGVSVNSSKGTFNINILEYLAYGTYQYQRGQGNVFIRSYIKPNQTFSINISYSRYLENEVINIFKMISTFGGVGSKTRNGFGSFKIRSINNEEGDYYFNLKKGSYLAYLPKYSAFSQKMRLWRTNIHDKWDDALAELGIAYREARGKIEKKHRYEKRQYIGAPIIIGKKQASKLDRHSKPYFMSVHYYENNNYIGYILYLPSEYAYGKENFNNSEETKHFKEACNSLNQYLSTKLEEVTL